MKKLLPLALLAVVAAPLIGSADVEDRLYDFTDTFYRQNGVDPAKIGGRRQAVLPLAAADAPLFSHQRPVRSLLTLPAYDHSGNVWFFTVHGGLSGEGFTKDAAGARARQIADASPEYLFPKKGTDPTGLGALRQDAILDMRKGYFSNNKLGLWIHIWISYTSKALTTSDGQKTLRDLAARNGRDLDGTPIIATVSEIDNLFQKGYITKLTKPFSDPVRYAICPVVKDPTDGGIAPDQFLAYTRTPDGTPLVPEFVQEFESLRTTGEPAD